MRRYHPDLPSSYELEEQKLRELELANTSMTTVMTPFTLAAAGRTSTGRQLGSEFNNQVCIKLYRSRS